jgi:hypothetical protein
MAACALVVSACDSSPVAVSVNSQKVKQTAVNADLRAYAENAAYVKAVDSNSQNQSAGVSVAGSAPGTYNAKFVAHVVTLDATDVALRQYLAAHHELPSAGLLAAERGWQAAQYGDLWIGFPASFRDVLAQQAADQAQFVTTSTDTASLRGAYKEAAGYLFAQVCVRQVSFTVDNGSGNVDYQASLAKADQARSGPLGGGMVVCYSPQTLEAQGESVYKTVVSLGAGQATKPQKTSFGYQIYQVTRRVQLPFDTNMARTVTQVADEQEGKPVSSLEQKVLTAAKVHLNPQYGVWSPQAGVTPVVPKVSGS